MFTGIVEELGEVIGLDRRPDSATLTVRGPHVLSDVTHGASIAVNGCCLTVVGYDEHSFTADVMAQTLDRTSLGALAPGSPVNLERAVRADGRLGGHLVQGHVDGTGTVLERRTTQHWEEVRVSVADHLARYLVAQGSVTVDGTSLTVVDVDDTPSGCSFAVSLIPETLATTTLGSAGVGSVVNLEVDVLAKYVERLLTTRTNLPRPDIPPPTRPEIPPPSRPDIPQEH